MSFELKERIFAVDPQAVPVLFPELLAQFGEDLPDGNSTIHTIGAHWDDAEKTRVRAASLTDGTIQPQPLTDGRVAFRCLWQTDLAAAYDHGQFPEAKELTLTQLQNLTPNGT